MVKIFYLRQRAEIGLDGLKVAISISKTKNVQDSRKYLKMKTWSHFSMEIAVRPLNNNLELAISKRLHTNLGVVQKVEIGYHMN